MSAFDIWGAVLGTVSLIALFVLLFIGIASAEKTENNKREVMKEVALYYKHRNEMFEKESEDKD